MMVVVVVVLVEGLRFVFDCAAVRTAVDILSLNGTASRIGVTFRACRGAAIVWGKSYLSLRYVLVK